MTKRIKGLTGFVIFSLVLINLSYFSPKADAQDILISENPKGISQETTFRAPEDIEEIKKLGEKTFEIGKKEFPNMLEKLWEENVLPVWKKMYDWFDTHIGSELKELLGEEIEKRKPIIEEEFKKEKQEMKEDLPKVSKSIWERLKELWKD